MGDICTRCAGLDLASKFHSDLGGVNGAVFSQTFEALQVTADHGCPLCRLILEAVVDRCIELRSGWTRQTAIKHHLELDREDFPITLDTVLVALDARFRGHRPTKGCVGLYVCRESGYEQAARLSISSNTSGNNVVMARQLQPLVDFDICKRWIDQCSNDHAPCGQIGDVRLPTRVIDVSINNDVPRLVETNGLCSRYIALSHCWGGKHPLMTTHANLEDHLRRLPMEKMPRTFRDAVIATRKLGFRHLWIDSLCIIQPTEDDPGDWSLESGKMSDYYGNCAVVIAAAAAPDTDAGFLHEREYTTFQYQYEFERPNSPVQKVVLALPQNNTSPEIRRTSVGSPIGRLPSGTPRLLRRAWAMQERYLASRVLYFGERDAFFECKHLTYRESYWHAPVTVPELGRAPKWSIHPSGGTRGKFTVRELWLTFVIEYTLLDLTYFEDRLPAISGVAKQYCQETGDDYYAGHLSGIFFQQLLWRHERSEDSNVDKEAPKPYAAPSWSWASCPGSVYFVNSQPEMVDTFETLVDVEDCRVIPESSDNPFGRLKSGELQVKGKLQHLVLVRRSVTRFGEDKLLVRQIDVDDENIGYCTLDRDDLPREDGSEISVICLLLQKWLTPKEQFWTGLALRNDQGGHYQRIGLIERHFSQVYRHQLDFEKHWGGVQERSIVIV